MYKLLLCLRYLRTRYIALASVVSVTLGVATMIVVNSVMAGFTHEMQSRIHGILSDVVVESRNLDGFHDPARHMQMIRQAAGKYIAGMTPTVSVPGMLNFRIQGQWTTHQVNVIGVDERTYNQVSDFSQYLQHPQNRKQLCFDLREDGYDTRDHQAGSDAPARERMEIAGWKYRRIQVPYWAEREAEGGPAPEVDVAPDPFQKNAPPEEKFDASRQQHTGIVIGIALASYRAHDGSDRFLVLPGEDVKITVPTASFGKQPQISNDLFTVVDFYESKMSEYDSNFVFVPLSVLQKMRGMNDPATGVGNATSIQIKLHHEPDGKLVRDILQRTFPPELYFIQTWRDKQGPLLAAVQMETAILNVLLFLIIAVAGFGILAIFYMIVVEKTRDIGILKSLGAPSRGIMGIFLAYGLSLGILGSGVGMVIGLLFVAYINNIADLLAYITGREVFDPTIYYFQQIPTIVEPLTVGWIVAGAMLIAVIASILPARRAARLHPVEALRYE